MIANASKTTMAHRSVKMDFMIFVVMVFAFVDLGRGCISSIIYCSVLGCDGLLSYYDWIESTGSC